MAKLNEIEIVVCVKFSTKISFWQALKLRLAGGEAIRKFIETKVEEIANKESIELLKDVCDDLDKSGPLYSKIKELLLKGGSKWQRK